MELELSDARIAIAGSSRGLGLALARQLQREGAEVWITGRNPDTVKAACREHQFAHGTACDLEQERGRSAFVQEVTATWGILDALILNIGSGKTEHRGLETPDHEWNRVFNLNFLTHASLLREFKPLLLKSTRGAAVVSISSIAGQARIGAPLSYGAAKSALDHFCHTAAAELAGHGIRYNVVAPGNVFVPGGRWDELSNSDPKKVKDMLEHAVPLKRFGTPEEIASFVAFLASNRASFCTGAVIRVDGGQTP